jgi:hypothetical protein
MASPVIDREDLKPAGMILIVVLLVLGTAALLGLAVRVFLFVSGLLSGDMPLPSPDGGESQGRVHGSLHVGLEGRVPTSGSGWPSPRNEFRGGRSEITGRL